MVFARKGWGMKTYKKGRFLSFLFSIAISLIKKKTPNHNTTPNIVLYKHRQCLVLLQQTYQCNRALASSAAECCFGTLQIEQKESIIMVRDNYFLGLHWPYSLNADPLKNFSLLEGSDKIYASSFLFIIENQTSSGYEYLLATQDIFCYLF